MDKSKAVPTIHANQPVEMVPSLDETPRTAVRKQESARICMEYAAQEESSLSSEEQDLQSCDSWQSPYLPSWSVKSCVHTGGLSPAAVKPRTITSYLVYSFNIDISADFVLIE